MNGSDGAHVTNAGAARLWRAQTGDPVGQMLTTATDSPMKTNWYGTFAIGGKLLQPETEAEMVSIVKELAVLKHQPGNENLTLKVVGAGHSFSNITTGADYVVRLDKMAHIGEVDANCRVTIGAGTRLGDAIDALAAKGYALTNMGDIADQAIAGVISTGTHGSGLGLGNVSTAVVGLRLLTADGTIYELSREKDPELFKAAALGLGSLGGILDVTMQVEKQYKLEEITGTMPAKTVLANLDQLVKDHRHVQINWDGKSEEAHVTIRKRDDDRGSGDEIPHLTEKSRRTDVSQKVLLWGPEWKNDPRTRAQEWVVKADRLPEVLERLNQRAKELGVIPSLDPTTDQVGFIIRFVCEDDLPMSPAYGQSVAYIGVLTGNPGEDGTRWLRQSDEFFMGLEPEFGARPHPGKETYVDGRFLAKAYPETYEPFVALRKKLDPTGMFLTDFTRRMFTPDVE
jgi:FAD/FMN-containing dehydrogenase